MKDKAADDERLPVAPNAATGEATRSHGKNRGTGTRSVLSYVPTAVVFLGLGALGAWGHHTGWRVPKFSDLVGRSAPEQKEDWCEAHNVPDSRCIACHPELAGADAKDWCKEHGVPESRCTVCHPEILTKGVAGDWCREHGVPESGCTICHPEIAVKGEVSPSDASPSVTADPSTTPIRDPATCQTHAVRIQFASPEAVQKAGVELAPVQERPMVGFISANGEITYDQTRVAQVSVRVGGTAWRVEKAVGDTVRKGDVLALVDATDVGRAKADLLQAAALVEVKAKALQRATFSSEKGFGTEAELQEAEAAFKEARIRLFNARQALVNLGFVVPDGESADVPQGRDLQLLGVPEPIRRELDADATTANLIPVTSPLDGVVTARHVVAGELVEPSRPLFVVADTRRMWLMLDVSHSDARRLAIGQDVHFRSASTSDESVTGTLSWISTAIDEKIRTVRVRADVQNTEGRLFANTFGSARIIVRKSATAIAVPDEAIQWEGCCHVVFVRLTDDIFQTRKVKLGARNASFAEVLVGVLPGEVVASAGSFVLKSELLKSRLGAGCVDD